MQLSYIVALLGYIWQSSSLSPTHFKHFSPISYSSRLVRVNVNIWVKHFSWIEFDVYICPSEICCLIVGCWSWADVGGCDTSCRTTMQATFLLVSSAYRYNRLRQSRSAIHPKRRQTWFRSNQIRLCSPLLSLVVDFHEERDILFRRKVGCR